MKEENNHFPVEERTVAQNIHLKCGPKSVYEEGQAFN